MSRQSPRSMAETESAPMGELAGQLHGAWTRFRESRLYVQAVLAAALVGLTGLAAVLPAAPLARVRHALTWTATHDYDFAGEASRANAWAQARGGWRPAVAGVWRAGRERVQTWVERVRPAQQGGPLAPAGSAPAPAPAPAGSAPAATAAPTGPTGPTAPADPSRSQSAPGWAPPVANAAVLYGYGWLPKGVSDKLHEGIDFAAPVATPVVAVSDGSVTRITSDPQLGSVVEVKHGALTALYAQVETIQVQVGDRVQRGQTLAVVGKPTGAEKAMQPHLHFAVRPAGKQSPVDPSFYLGLGGNKH